MPTTLRATMIDILMTGLSDITSANDRSHIAQQIERSAQHRADRVQANTILRDAIYAAAIRQHRADQGKG